MTDEGQKGVTITTTRMARSITMMAMAMLATSGTRRMNGSRGRFRGTSKVGEVVWAETHATGVRKQKV